MFRVKRIVEFADTDMAGIVHFAQFFNYMEAAEHAFFRSLGISVVTRQVDPPVGWPRVHAVPVKMAVRCFCTSSAGTPGRRTCNRIGSRTMR